MQWPLPKAFFARGVFCGLRQLREQRFIRTRATAIDILIHTDHWDFRLHTSTPYDDLKDYWSTIEAWIDTLEIYDP